MKILVLYLYLLFNLSSKKQKIIISVKGREGRFACQIIQWGFVLYREQVFPSSQNFVGNCQHLNPKYKYNESSDLGWGEEFSLMVMMMSLMMMVPLEKMLPVGLF